MAQQEDYNKKATYGGVLKNPDDILKIAERAFELNKQRLGGTDKSPFGPSRASYQRMIDNALTGKLSQEDPILHPLIQQAVDEYKMNIIPRTPETGPGSQYLRGGLPQYEITPQGPKLVVPTDQKETSPEGFQISPDYKASSDVPQATDQSGWTDSMKQMYDALNQYISKMEAQGKRLNPNITIDDAIIQKFKNQAKTELDPYYSQVFQQAEEDIKRGLSQIGQDYETKARSLGLEYGKALEGTQEKFARKGLEFSSQRGKAEQSLADAAQRSLEGLQLGSQRQAGEIGIKGERELGSSLFPKSDMMLSGYSPTQGRAGVYGFQSIGGRSLFTPSGTVGTGTLQRDRLFGEEQRVRDLTEAERQYRAANYL